MQTQEVENTQFTEMRRKLAQTETIAHNAKEERDYLKGLLSEREIFIKKL